MVRVYSQHHKDVVVRTPLRPTVLNRILLNNPLLFWTLYLPETAFQSHIQWMADLPGPDHNVVAAGDGGHTAADHDVGDKLLK